MAESAISEDSAVSSTFQIFDIPEILEMIFEKLDTRSLRNCRLVSSTWNFEANRILKDQVKILPISNLETLRKFHDTIKTSMKRVSLPVQHLDISQIPHRVNPELSLGPVLHQIKVVEWFVDKRWASAGDMTNLIYKLCPNLEQLSIKYFELNKYLDELSDSFLPHPRNQLLPQLKQLHIKMCAALSGGNQRKVFNYLNCFLAGATGLKHLTLSSWMAMCHGGAQENVISNLTSLKLEKIEIDDFWASEDNLSALSTKLGSISLRVMRLEFVASAVDLKPLLRQCCGSLVELDIKVSRQHSYHNFPFGTKMNKLQILKLDGAGDKFWIDWSMLPQLRKMNLNRCSLHGIVTPMLASPSHASHLETLHIDSLSTGLNVHPLVNQTLSHVHSQLTRLKLRVWRDLRTSLAVVFRECFRLKYLSLLCVKEALDDKQICGMDTSQTLTAYWPSEETRNDNADGAQLQANLDIAYRNVIAHVRTPNFDSWRQIPFIGNLQDLQTLTLVGDFTELAVLLGVVHCRRLTSINLTSEMMNEGRAIRLIRQARLPYLTSVKINDQIVNHLP